MNKKISVIIPVYNVDNFIDDADVCSVQEQPCLPTDEKRLYNCEECIKLCIIDNPLVYTCWGKLYKAKSIKKNNIAFLDGKEAHEDSYSVFDCFYNGMNMVHLNHKIYYYNFQSNSLSKKAFSNKKFAIIELANKKYNLVNIKFPQFKSISTNILVKAHMALLSQMKEAKGYKKLEHESISFVCKNKKYFIPAIEYDKKLFFIITNHLYGLYKFLYIFKGINTNMF